MNLWDTVRLIARESVPEFDVDGVELPSSEEWRNHLQQRRRGSSAAVGAPSGEAAAAWVRVGERVYGPGPVDGGIAVCPDRLPDGWSDSMVVQIASGTPPTNRGVELTKPDDGIVRFGIDYLKISIFGVTVSEVLEWIMASLLGAGFQDDPAEWFSAEGETRLYRELFTGIHGMSVCGSPKGNQPPHVLASFPGECCRAVGVHRLQGFMLFLAERQVRFQTPRIDACWDGSAVSPELMKTAIKARDLRTRVKFDRLGPDGVLKPSWDAHENDLGETTSLGNRSSGLLRVYNKHGFNRVELQAMAERAKNLGALLVLTPLDQWPTVCMGVLRDFVDVVDRKADSNVSRCPLVSWWSEFVQGAERAGLSCKRIVRASAEVAAVTVRKARVQVERVARSLVKRGELFLAAVQDHVRELKQAAGPGPLGRMIDRAVEVVQDDAGLPFSWQVLNPRQALPDWGLM